ncbi:MAG: hypothetical protein KGJ35_00315 [Patescibacteria group bacterium]|nr:hypothetical protein [Patescibacteria group bacterium]
MFIADKNLGETPLECLERARCEKGIAADVPMTYAGRLDPLAEGKLLLLVGDECKEKEKYLGLDKEYEIEVLFGVKTDTGDMMGLITEVRPWTNTMSDLCTEVGHRAKFAQEYPAFSSKTVSTRSDLGKKRQLHELARTGELPDEMPTKEVEIYSIDELGKSELSGRKLAERAAEAISKVHGDFRQEKILENWQTFATEHGGETFSFTKLRVYCSSGTYMRALAERMGGMAISINRTKIVKVTPRTK